ncbi:hypothetical protein G5C68_06115 [Lacticaseibacillus paracasei]|nr:hypothetical protein G5C68_06115 [Lacticaseibacillus paracasei]
MLCKHHFSKNGQVFFHIFWVVTLIMQSRQISQLCGVLSGLFCALMVVALRNWKKVSFFSAKPSN